MGPTHEGSLAERKRLLEIDESAFVGGLAVLTTVLETVTDQFLRALESSEGVAETDKPMHESACAVRTQILRLKQAVGVRRAEVRMGEPEEASEADGADGADGAAPSVFVQQASDPKTSRSSLTLLAKHPDPFVRCAVARNPSTPSPVLAGISFDADVSVRLAVARNPSTPFDTVTRLVRDEDIMVGHRAILSLEDRF